MRVTNVLTRGFFCYFAICGGNKNEVLDLVHMQNISDFIVCAFHYGKNIIRKLQNSGHSKV